MEKLLYNIPLRKTFCSYEKSDTYIDIEDVKFTMNLMI